MKKKVFDDGVFSVFDLSGQANEENGQNLAAAVIEIVERIDKETSPADWLSANVIPAPIRVPKKFFHIIEAAAQKYATGMDGPSLGAAVLNSMIIHAIQCFVSRLVDDTRSAAPPSDSENDYSVRENGLNTILGTM